VCKLQADLKSTNPDNFAGEELGAVYQKREDPGQVIGTSQSYQRADGR
jgi:hypothetical protein